MTDRVYYSQEAEERAKQQRQFLASIFLILGASVGAALALMFAPNDGEKNRQYLAERGNDIAHAGIEKLSDEISNLRERVESLLP